MQKIYKNFLSQTIVALGLCTILCLSSTSFAKSPKLLDEERYQQLVKDIKLAPGNLSKDQKLIRELSHKQLSTLVESFNVGHYGYLHPMNIKCEELEDVLGQSFDKFSLMSVWDGKLKPIPFQFDEFDNKSRYIYIPKINKDPIDGTHLIGDPNDELVFMYRDSSEQQYHSETMPLSEGNIVKEIMIKDVMGNQRYVYLVENNSQRSDVDYISTDIEESKIVSSYYHIEYDPKNFLNFKDVRPYVGTAADQRVIDNIYFELSANIFSRFVKVGLNSADNIRIKVLGVKDGPVRSTALVKLGFVFGKIPIFSMQSEISFYEQGLVMPNRTEVGKGALFARVFKNAEIIVYVDMNGIDGGTVSAQAFKDEQGKRLYGTVDGKMDAQESKAAEAGHPGDWTWIDSGLGWDIFMAFTIPMDSLDGMSMKVYYQDDKELTSKFETFPGAGPRIGLTINGMPNNMKALESLEMEYAFWFPDTVGAGGPDAFYHHEQNPPLPAIRNFNNAE